MAKNNASNALGVPSTVQKKKYRTTSIPSDLERRHASVYNFQTNLRIYARTAWPSYIEKRGIVTHRRRAYL